MKKPKNILLLILYIILILILILTVIFFIKNKINYQKNTTKNNPITNFKIFYQEVWSGSSNSSEIQINNDLTLSVIDKNWGSCVGCYESTKKYIISINQTEFDNLNQYIPETKKYQNDYTGKIDEEKAEDGMITFYILDTVDQKIVYLRDITDETLKTNLIHLIVPILNRKTPKTLSIQKSYVL